MVSPYITFHGNCHEAMSFYQEAFQSEDPTSLPYGEYVPEGVTEPPSDLADWILHAEMDICGTSFWFSDEVAEPVQSGNQIMLTAKVPTKTDAQNIFDRLSYGAKITLSPTETFYCNFHGALTDRYGVCWNIVSEEAPSQPE